MSTTHEILDAPPQEPARRRLGPVTGLVGVAVALGISELFAGINDFFPSLITALAVWVIDIVPRPVKEFAISTFGTKDKLALGIGIVVVALAIGALVGGRRIRRWVFVGFGLVAAWAATRSPLTSVAGALLAGLVAAGAGVGTMEILERRSGGDRPTDEGRRQFIRAAAGLGTLAVLMAAGGRALADRARIVIAGRDQVVLPPAAEALPAPAAGTSLQVAGITPVVVPNSDFYRIDTAPFSVPRVDLEAWRLTIKGMVGREIELSYQDLLGLPLIERYVTLSCVSNEVGGHLVGNAKWLGYPLHLLLEKAGVADGAQQVVGRSVDGFTVGFPVDAVFDGRDAIVAIGMNGEPLPFEHGFPARLVIEGLYGYVSATKWLSEIELTTWDGFDAYWVPRGWSKEAPIKTQSRIDTPQRGSSLSAGAVTIAGVAWAPGRGVSQVEVSIDEGSWEQATLSTPLSKGAWLQWEYGWQATPGRHTLQVRATDGDGVVQDSQVRPPAPDGATGYHTITVNVA